MVGFLEDVVGFLEDVGRMLRILGGFWEDVEDVGEDVLPK